MATISLKGVNEKDIDLLFAEELFSSDAFFRWFLLKAGVEDSFRLSAISRSITTASGETDLHVELENGNSKVFVLLENKLDSPFRPGQSARYRERADAYVRSGECRKCLTGLLAPATYLPHDGSMLGFDFVIEYGDVQLWFSEQAGAGLRKRFKRAVLERAIERSSRGYVKTPDRLVSEFWMKYWEISQEIAPELQMPRPEPKGKAATFIRFNADGLLKDNTLMHKVSRKNESCDFVDLQFANRGNDIELFRREYGHQIEPGMRIEQTNKSAVVRIEVPKIDVTVPFEESEIAVREGLWAAKLLLVWYKQLHRA
ncbi:MAG: hypothetical protein HND42_09010 [Armatimonadetes bacterium]|nr:hypothetical protein [Armatimonadota bacterium]NOG93363.1 hypothetical protein [Armatimonadota bacterium]